jgi:hypothetical protein
VSALPLGARLGGGELDLGGEEVAHDRQPFAIAQHRGAEARSRRRHRCAACAEAAQHTAARRVLSVEDLVGLGGRHRSEQSMCPAALAHTAAQAQKARRHRGEQHQQRHDDFPQRQLRPVEPLNQIVQELAAEQIGEEDAGRVQRHGHRAPHVHHALPHRTATLCTRHGTSRALR